MNIILINQYAGSIKHGMEFRPFYLGREWSKLGHHVTVVAASPSHVRVREPHLQGSLTEEHIEGLRYLWLKTPSYRGNGVRRAVNIMTFAAQLFRQRSRIIDGPRPDVVIASSTHPLDIFPAYRIARSCGARLVFEVHDLWPLSPMELGGLPWWHPFIFLLQRGEDFACRRCDHVVSILPLANLHLHGRGMANEKYSHVPNGIDVEEWACQALPLPELHQAAVERARAQGRILIGYAGAHGVANALHIVLDAAERLQCESVTFLLVGQGPAKADLEGLLASRRLSNVSFLPPLSKDAIPAFLSAMDVLYLGLARQPLFRFGVSPNKLFDYMMAGRPIIQAIEAGNDLVAEAGCGISCPAEDPAAIVLAVRELMRHTPQERDRMGGQGRNYVLRHHDYRVLAQKFLEVLQ
jgi:glycosyltransferase involved in cell wall biosynthesis